MKRVVITGAQGFVGRYLVDALLASDPNLRIVGLGRSQACETFTHCVTLHSARVPAPLPAAIERARCNRNYEYAQCDIGDRQVVRPILREFRPDAIFHLASGLRDDAPQKLFGTNVEGTIAFLEGVHEAGLNLHSLVIASSGSVYGTPANLPIAEDVPCEPRDFYAVSKLAQEHASRIVARERGLPLIVGRIFNVVGPGQDERHAVGRFAAQLSAVAAGPSARCRIQVGDLSTTRDFIDVRDVAGAFVALARHGEPGGAYNVASGVETSISRILELLIGSAGLRERVEIETTYARASDIPRVVADVTRLRAAGCRTAVALERSLLDVSEYYRQTPATVRRAS